MRNDSPIPKYVASALWSYDVNALETEKDKRLIIKHVLDYGSTDAIRWLQQTYPASDITTTLRETPRSAWGRKSLALWSLVYNTTPARERRTG